MFRIWKSVNDTDALYEIAHQIGIKKYLAKKGIDVEKEIMKQDIISKLKNKRSIRRRLEYETYKEMFGDDKNVPPE